MTLPWFFRQAWRELTGMPREDTDQRVSDLDVLRVTQWDEDFERLMRNRLLMGAFRYGPFRSGRQKDYDNIASIHRHAEQYAATGNTEHLVDIANLALVEFVHGQHPSRHFNAIDDGEHTKAFGGNQR